MGAWSANSFGNDDALDWLADLSDGKDDLILETLNKVAQLPPTEYLEAPECCQALAAAELVAAASGAPPVEEFPEEATAWLSSHQLVVDSKLLDAVRQCIARISTNSELRELWDESDSKQEWYQSVEDLKKRIG